MNKLPKVSVVVLNYNGEEYLKKTIVPILELDYQNFEFIVVDNGSTDKSLEYLEKFKFIKIISNNDNLGYSKGKNIGVGIASGQFVLLLDNDVILKKTIINELLLFYNSLKDVAFVSLVLVEPDKIDTIYYGGFLMGLFQTKPVKVDDLQSSSNNIEISWPNGGGIFFEKKVWVDIGGFDESQPFYLDDFDVGLRALNFGYKQYLFTKLLSSHIGIRTKQSEQQWIWKHQYYLSGFLRAYLKNLKIHNFLLLFFKKQVEFFLKVSFHFLKNHKISTIKIIYISNKIFFMNLFDTLEQRRIIQSKRVISEDIVFKLKPPDFK